MKAFFTCVVFFLFAVCNSQTIQGKVVDAETGNPVKNVDVYLAKKELTKSWKNVCYWENFAYKIIRRTKTDDLGNYKFSNIRGTNFNVVANYLMPVSKKYGFRTMRSEIDSNINFKEANYYSTIRLMITCPYDKTQNLTSCPQCGKEDMVVPILFGLPNYDSTGNINGSPPDSFYLAGCIVDAYCNPSKHCNRCSNNF